MLKKALEEIGKGHTSVWEISRKLGTSETATEGILMVLSEKGYLQSEPQHTPPAPCSGCPFAQQCTSSSKRFSLTEKGKKVIKK
ncbi:hypothetical protein GF415_01650 [Candidatus Micrarchaeota archaeon]|nr:hypothetical protein [Candidatus Micrarchaeota archaeon]